MEKQKNYTIKEVSSLLNISKATIRYWDSQGLIFPERNQENDYRSFPLQVVMELSNISFFRSINIPIKELKRMLESDVEVQKELLEEAETRIEKKILELERQRKRIRRQQQALAEMTHLKKESLQKSQPIFQKVVLFKSDCKQHWNRIIRDPGAFVLVFKKEEKYSYLYGIGCQEDIKPDETVLWEAGDSCYLEGLLVTDSYNEARNNLALYVEELKKKKKRPRVIVAQYLASGLKGEDEVRDYYKMWMEVEDT